LQNGQIKGGLNPQQMSTHFILEGHLPGCNTRGLMTENEVISLFPDDPCTDHKDLHEEIIGKIPFGKIIFLMNIRAFIPIDSIGKPADNCRGAIKEEMLNRLFNILMTEHTTITIIKMLPSPSQNIPSI
jgi:hypothetical protein